MGRESWGSNDSEGLERAMDERGLKTGEGEAY